MRRQGTPGAGQVGRGSSARARALGAASLGLAAVTEMAHLVADPLRARAQSRLAALSPEIQRHRLATSQTAEAADARRISEAIESLIADTAPTL